MCGIFACTNTRDSSLEVAMGLRKLSHRGEDGCGIISADHRKFHAHKDVGNVINVYTSGFDFKSKIPGKTALGHCRYPTSGSNNSEVDLQPLLYPMSKWGKYCVAHNGQLVDYRKLRNKIIRKMKQSPVTTSDTALLPCVMNASNARNIENAIAEAALEVKAAFSLVVMSKDRLIALKDVHGIKPLFVGKRGKEVFISSETCAFPPDVDRGSVYSLKAGEMIICNKDTRDTELGYIKKQYSPARMAAPCCFEWIYFSNDTSSDSSGGDLYSHHEFRKECGRSIGLRHREYFDSLRSECGDDLCIMGVPHSGISGSLGLADATGIRIDHEGIQKMSNSFKGRSFTAATGSEREIIARSKHHINDKYVKGKVIILGDDSKVRNNAARVLIANLKLAGAKRIIEVIFAPPVREICYMGINHNDKKDLIAANCSLDEIARKSGAEKVIYLDRIDMKSLIESCYGYDNFCDGCFGGSYPV